MLSMVSFRETSSRSRIGRMAHSLVDTGITCGIVISGRAKVVGRFKTFKISISHWNSDMYAHSWNTDANVVMSVT